MTEHKKLVKLYALKIIDNVQLRKYYVLDDLESICDDVVQNFGDIMRKNEFSDYELINGKIWFPNTSEIGSCDELPAPEVAMLRTKLNALSFVEAG